MLSDGSYRFDIGVVVVVMITILIILDVMVVQQQGNTIVIIFIPIVFITDIQVADTSATLRKHHFDAYKQQLSAKQQP